MQRRAMQPRSYEARRNSLGPPRQMGSGGQVAGWQAPRSQTLAATRWLQGEAPRRRSQLRRGVAALEEGGGRRSRQ
jgi:hypothetical protein